MFKKIIGAVFMMAVAYAALAVNVVQAQALEKKKITIAVGGQGLFYCLPLTTAERNGYFKGEGLKWQPQQAETETT